MHTVHTGIILLIQFAGHADVFCDHKKWMLYVYDNKDYRWLISSIYHKRCHLKLINIHNFYCTVF